MVNIKGELSFGLERLQSPKKLFETDHLADNSSRPNLGRFFNMRGQIDQKMIVHQLHDL